MYAITSICEKSRHGRSKLPGRDHPGVSGPCPHPHAAAQQHRGCGFVISFILRTILRARAELAPSPTPRLRRVVTRLHRGPRRWFLAVRSCRSPRRFDRAISRFFDFFDFSLEKPATRPRDRCGKEQLVYPFVTGFPGSSRVSALAPYSSGDRVGSTLSAPHAGGDLGLFRW